MDCSSGKECHLCADKYCGIQSDGSQPEAHPIKEAFGFFDGEGHLKCHKRGGAQEGDPDECADCNLNNVRKQVSSTP